MQVFTGYTINSVLPVVYLGVSPGTRQTWFCWPYPGRYCCSIPHSWIWRLLRVVPVDTLWRLLRRYLVYSSGGPVLRNVIWRPVQRSYFSVLSSATILKLWFPTFSAKIQPFSSFFVSNFGMYRKNCISCTSTNRRAPLVDVDRTGSRYGVYYCCSSALGQQGRWHWKNDRQATSLESRPPDGNTTERLWF